MNVYDLTCTDLTGKELNLSHLKGKVAMFVNVASECGYTKQYSELQKLHESYSEKSFSVIAFPCNDFGEQEPGDEAAIRHCANSYNAKFPLMSKVSIKREEDRCDVYSALAFGAGAIPAWNFGKYIVNQEGNAIQFFGPNITPNSNAITNLIDTLIS